MISDYKRQFVLLLLFAAAILLAGIGLRDPWPADEPRFALIARDMVASGNWLLPYVGGVIYPDKPPLFFWAIAAFYTLTDSLRVSFLLPGALAGIGTIVLVTDLGRRLWGPTTGIWCGAVLLALVQFPIQMKSGQIDGLLCFWTTLGLYGFSRHLLLGPDWRSYTIGGMAAGLGVITKGVGFLPYLIFIPYVLAVRRNWSVLRHTGRDARWLLAPAASLLAIGIWLVPMLVATSGNDDPTLTAYRDNILFHQTVTRYADSWGHIKPPWYLFTNAIPWLWLPLTPLLPWLIPAWRRDIKGKNAATLLLGSWLLLVLLFFSISMGKRSLYIFPAAPALALIAGFHAQALMRRAGPQRVIALFPVVLALVLIAVAMYALMNPHAIDRWVTDVPTILKASASVVVTGILMLAVIAVFRRRQCLKGFVTTMAIFWIAVSILVAPAINETRSGGALMASLEARLPANTTLGFVAWPEQFVLQWDKPVNHFGFRRDAAAQVSDAVRWLSFSENRRVLLPDHLVDSCLDSNQVIPVGIAHRRRWVLASRSALIDSCDTGLPAPQLVVYYSPPGRSGSAQ